MDAPRLSPDRPSRLRVPPLTTCLLSVLLAGSLPADAGAQDGPGWDSPRALELVERARLLRQRTWVDTAFRAYSAEATGHVYFLLDRPDSDERTLVKADQIALEVYWQAPGRTKQRIVGLRDEKVLPTNIRYHLDHLTVVQDDFQDLIRLGDGDEVAAVLHPVAPGAETVYDYRVVDSLTLSFGGVRPDVRVYEVAVRPEEVDRPGFVGSVFLDRESAAIVRMSFTFTPASYVDPYLDYIRISLDNSLWEGRYWLPYRQEAELRRELPQLDFLAGSVIRGRFLIGDYRFNPPLPPGLFDGPSVTTVAEEEREAYPFDEPLLPGTDDREALATPPTLEEVRERAREMVAGRALSGLRRLRLHVPSASDVFRYGRGEGAYLGLGFAWRPAGRATLAVHGGWSFGREEVSAEVRVSDTGRVPSTGVRLYLDDMRDLGPVAGASGVVNTLAALVDDRDWLDPWFATGIEAFHTVELTGTTRLRIAASAERHESAEMVVDDPRGFRPVLPVAEGDELAVTAGLSHGTEEGAHLVGEVTGARFEGREWAAANARLRWRGGGAGRVPAWELAGRAGAVTGDAPPQRLFLLGGRGTLPGHPYRDRVGERFWLVSGEARRPVWSPWLSAGLFGAAGQATMDPADVPAGWTADPSAGVTASVGAVLGLAWDVLELRIGRGLGGGGWATEVWVSERFRGWL